MKNKILTILSVSALLFTSCSENDENSGENQIDYIPKLPIKSEIIETDSQTGTTYTYTTTTEFNYDDEYKLVGVTTTSSEVNVPDEISEFIYQNDKIVQRNDYNSDNELLSKVTYSYSNDLVNKKSLYYNGGNELFSETTYEYNSEGVLIESTEVDIHDSLIISYEYLSDEKVKLTYDNDNSNYSIVTLDDKNTPFSDISYLKPILIVNGYFDHNFIKWENYYNNTITWSTDYYSSYDSDSFLIERENNDGPNATYKTIYTYNR